MMNQTDDDISKMPMWKSYLYHLQQQAPKPKIVTCQYDITNKPRHYGKEYHGAISREEADFMLTIGGEGSYLIRESQRAPGQCTLVIKFEGTTKNFKLYYDGQHYVGEKRFDQMHDLVADGLITFYLESKAADYIAAIPLSANYAESPYAAFNTLKRQQQQKQVSRPLPRNGNHGNQDSPSPQLKVDDRQSASGSDTGTSVGSNTSNSFLINNSGNSQPLNSFGFPQSINISGQAINNPVVRQRHSQPVEPPRLPEKGRGLVDDRRSQFVPPTNRNESPHTSESPIRVPQKFTILPSDPKPGKDLKTTHSNDHKTTSSPQNTRNIHNPVDLLDGKLSKLGSVMYCNDYLDVMGSEKPHNFKLYTFKGPHWCDFCANFLWGLIAQGVKCQDCGFNAHKKCSEKIPNDCMPDMKYVKRMFGVDLTTLVKAQNMLIPVVVEMCIKEIELRGIESEGIYRVAGFHDDVEAIRMSFDKDGEQTDISMEKYEDLNTIASVLKLYFRLLPIPLISFDVYIKIVDTMRREGITPEERDELLKQNLTILPPAHYHTLKFLIAHLHRVTDRQSLNMMSAENLAIIFAPTLLRSPETDPLFSLLAVRYERELIEILISKHTILFNEDSAV